MCEGRDVRTLLERRNDTTAMSGIEGFGHPHTQFVV
ncbi:co-chaperonin GroES [Synechococcus sp. WH 7805]|nr:co-chaperonin GroES [Synechococcus sp. WH 7805]